MARAFNLVWNLDNGALYGAAGTEYLKRGETVTVTLAPTTGGAATLLSTGWALRLTLKPKDQFDADPLFTLTSWTEDSAAKTYTATGQVSSTQIDTLLKKDGDATNDVAAYDCVLDVYATTTAETTPFKTETIAVELRNDVGRTDDGTPTSTVSPDAYVAARAVLYDRAQSLSSGQKAQARANIGADSAGITVGTTTVTGGTNGNIIYDNAGVVGEIATSTGGNDTADAGKLVKFTPDGSVVAHTVTASALSLGTAVLEYDGLQFTDTANGGFHVALGYAPGLSADTSIAIPAVDGTMLTTGNVSALPAGSIANSKLANSAITIAGTSTSLGGSISQDTIMGLSSTGLVKRTAANTLGIAIAGTDYLTANQSISLSGDISGSGSTAITTAIGAGKVTNAMLAGSIVASSKLSATGTPSASTFLRGDDTWTTVTVPTAANPSASVGLTTTNGSAATFMRSDAAPALDVSIAPTWSGAHTFSKNSAASTPAVTLSGSWFSGGTGTTTFPHLLIAGSGYTPSTSWNTNGTVVGAKMAAGWAGVWLDFKYSNDVSIFKIDNSGALSTGGTITSGVSVLSASGSYVGWNGSTLLSAPSNGAMRLQTASATNKVNFIGTADDSLQLGLDAASPSSQVVKGPNGSGTDKDGGGLTLEGGQSTGTGRGGHLSTATSLTSTTGSSANSYSTRSYAAAKPVDLTESTATTFATIAVGASKIVGCTLACTVYANDGTDFQAITSNVRVDAINKGGTVTTTCTQTDNTAAVSAGTLTVTYTAAASGNNVIIKANAVSSLTQTVLRCKWAIAAMNSDDTAAVTAA